MALEGKTALSWWGFVCLCLASKKTSEWELFVPARMDLAVKLLGSLFSNSPCTGLSPDHTKFTRTVMAKLEVWLFLDKEQSQAHLTK